MHTKVQSLRDEVHLSVISEQVSLCEEPNPNRIRMSFYCQVCLHVFIFMTDAFTVQQNDKDKDEWRGHWTSPADHMLKSLAELQTHLLQPSLGLHSANEQWNHCINRQDFRQ